MSMLTIHPFVSTPNMGSCSSCGKKRSDPIHDLTRPDPETPRRDRSSVAQKLKIIQKRIDFLIDRIAIYKAGGKPFSYDASERDALIWAVGLAKENAELQDALEDQEKS